MIVEMEVFGKRGTRFRDRFVGLEIDLFILDAAPEPLDEDVVPPVSLAVHADVDMVGLQDVGEGIGRELGPLVRVEYLRGAVTLDSLFQGLDAGVWLECHRESPRQHCPGGPVHDGDEIAKAPLHGNVRHVRTPDVIGPRDGNAAQKVRVDLMRLIGNARPALRVRGFYAHHAHEALDALSVDRMTFGLEAVFEPAGAEERILEVQLIEPAHDGEIVVRDHGLSRVIHARPRQRQKLALGAYRQTGAIGKSFSTVSPPIFASSASRSSGPDWLPPLPKTSAARSISWRRHWVTCVGWTWCLAAISWMVFSPARASIATLALNYGE